MKKLLAFIVSIIILCIGTAIADPFTFSNGVQWGMNKADVIELYGADPVSSNEIGASISDLCYANQRVSKYTANIDYIFANDSLAVVGYFGFSSDTADDFDYLKNALSSVYGDPADLDADTVVTFFSDLLGEPTPLSFSSCYQWAAADDTQIWLALSDMGMRLLYKQTSFDPNTINTYDITAL